VYCKPGSADWDMQLSMYASVSYSGGSNGSQLIGSATVKKPGASITTLSSYVCSEEIAVKGTAAANGTVDIYDGETLIGSATANGKGLWEARVTLANTDSRYSSTHILTSHAASGAKSEDLYVFHDPIGPELTSFRMAWNGSNEINVGGSYVYAGGMRDLTFKAVFKNPERLLETAYGENGASVGVQTDGGAMFIAGVSGIAEPPVNDLWTVPGEENMLEEYKRMDSEFFNSIDSTHYFHIRQLTDFLDAIRNHREPLITLEDGRRTVELITGIYRSNRDRMPVKFPLVPENRDDFDGRLLKA
ncbi:MAG: hypothetical protein II889_02250, partial [Clostridia bacterium]|nr:hypothetical protein [Clostridia bacterium]